MLLVENNTSVCFEDRDILKGNFAKGRTESLGLPIKSRFQGTARTKGRFPAPAKSACL